MSGPAAPPCPSHRPYLTVGEAIASGRILGGYAECARCGKAYQIGSDADGEFEVEPGTGSMRKRVRYRVHYLTEMMEETGGAGGDAWCYPGDTIATDGSDWIRITSVDQETA